MDMPAASHALDRLADFPAIPDGWAYLDTAATAQKPRAVIDAISRAYGETYATVHRGVYERSSNMTLAFEASRRRVADFIGAASAEEIVFVRGATEAINLVAQSWGGCEFKPGDRILLSMLEHHSNIVPWQLIAERSGAVIDVAPLTADGRIDLDAVEAMLTERHKLVALAHVSNVLGSVLDARRAADARAQGRREAAARRLPGGAAHAGRRRRAWIAISTSFPPTNCTARPGSACCGRAPRSSTRCRPGRAAGR